MPSKRKSKRIKVRSATVEPKRASNIILGAKDAAIVWDAESESFNFYLSNEGGDDNTPMHQAVAILTMAFINIHNDPDTLMEGFAAAIDRIDEEEAKEKTKH